LVQILSRGFASKSTLICLSHQTSVYAPPGKTPKHGNRIWRYMLLRPDIQTYWNYYLVTAYHPLFTKWSTTCTIKNWSVAFSHLS